MTIDELICLRESNPKGYYTVLKHKYPDVLEEISKYNLDSGFDSTIPESQKIYNYINRISDWPTCPICGKRVKYEEETKKYRKHCSRTCSNKDNETLKKRTENTYAKYGVEHTTQLDSVKKSIEQAKQIKYGDSKYNNIEKAKQTNIERYGFEHASMCESIKTKISDTKLLKYGDPTYNNVRKAKETKKQKYGNEKYINIAKIEETCEIKYGQKRAPTSISALLDYHKETTLDFYEKYASRNSDCILITKKEDFKGMQYENEWKCKKCGRVFKTKGKFGIHPMCICTKKPVEQDQIVSYIKSIYDGEIQTNTRKVLNGKEIDIYLPDKKLGIEFNGLYWHSEIKHENQRYHLEKTEAANKLGIRLIQIFSDEWENERTKQILKTKLCYLLGNLHTKSIYARKCNIKRIDNKIAKRFMDKYHIQGSDNSKYYFGLYYGIYLIAVASFQPTGKNGIYVLSRYATIKTKTVVGGLGKIISRIHEFLPDVKTIRTFADRRYSNGDLYEKLGFIKTKISRPYYWYTYDFKSRIHRFNIRKKFFGVDASDKTESELAAINGFVRIWDCGQITYEYTFN